MPSSHAAVLVTKDYARTTIGPSRRPMVRALAEAMLGPDGELSEERLDALVSDLDAFISPASKTLRFGLVGMLTIIRWSPFFFGKLRPFDDLSLEDRMHHLERLERSKVAQLPMLVIAYKTMLTMLFYEDSTELAAIGYPGEERTRWRRRLPQVETQRAS